MQTLDQLLHFLHLIDKSPLKRERIEGTDLVFLRELTSEVFILEKEEEKTMEIQHMTPVHILEMK